MIMYFSGTGNSRYVAEIIGKVINDKTYSMNEYIKYNNKKLFSSKRPYIFVCPSYVGRIPRIVEKFIDEVKFNGSNLAYFIMTCGESIGNAEKYIKKLCVRKNFKFMGVSAIKMPFNYILLNDIVTDEEANDFIESETPKVYKLAEDIKERKIIHNSFSLAKNKYVSNLVNPLFYKFAINPKGFYSTSKCDNCGKCIEVCPLNNVTFDENNKLNWSNQCTNCMACINSCHKSAIEYKEATLERNRYYNNYKIEI